MMAASVNRFMTVGDCPVRWSELWLKLAEKHCSG